jgi:hypothetical protein
VIRALMNCRISPLIPENLNTTFLALLRQNWLLPTIWPLHWPECRMKTGSAESLCLQFV